MDSKLFFRARVVHSILLGKSEEALELLSQHYNVAVPKLRVGLPKGFAESLGCYVAKNGMIHVLNRENMCSPYVIVHEFYHHLRTHGREHKGTEKHAKRFAEEFLRAYELFQSTTEQQDED